MSSRQSDRRTGTTGQGRGLGAPGTTGASGARDPLGAPGSTGASMTTAGAPGYDPTEYGAEGGGQQQLHRPAADEGTGQGHTYGSAGRMESTDTGYHSGVHVPHTTGVTIPTTEGAFDTGDFGSAGLGSGGVGYDTGMGDRAYGVGRERGGHQGMPVGSTGVGSGGGYDTGMGERAHGLGRERGGHQGMPVGGAGVGSGEGGYDTGMGERAHGLGRERGGHLEVPGTHETADTVIITGEVHDASEMGEWARGVGGEKEGTLAGSGTGGARHREGQRRT